MKPSRKSITDTGIAFLVISMFAQTLFPREEEEPPGQTGLQVITPAAAKAIAREAYLYGFPLVMNLKTIYNYTVDTKNPEYKGPFNMLSCEARLFTPDDKAVVTPNADTPYCMFWMDLRAEPMVLSVPEMEPKRFYQFQLIDLYTHNFAYVGNLTTGNGAGKYLIAGPGWKGERPKGISEVIKSETNFVFNITRTQLFGPDDLAKVKEIQSSYGLEPLSSFLGTAPPLTKSLPDFPKWVEGSQFDERFFGYLDFAMSLLGNPGEREKRLWDELARLGIGPANTFAFASLSPEIQDALKEGVKDGSADIEKFVRVHGSDPLVSAKIFGTRAFLTESAVSNYQLETPDILRSVAAQTGLYGNSAKEAIYPTYFTDADKEPLDASTGRYTLTFKKGELPPVKAFWSLSIYDGETQLFIKNPLDRYLLNSSMMEKFMLEDDGSLVLYIAKETPDKELEANWLPAPDGPFYLTMRLYGPKTDALEGKWTPPAVKKSK